MILLHHTLLLFALSISVFASHPCDNESDSFDCDPDMHLFVGRVKQRPANTSTATWLNANTISNSTELVTLRIKASVPSVNLINVPGFLDVVCTNSTATARFSNSSDISTWTVGPTLLLISEEYRCGKGHQQQFSMLLATTWTLFNNSVVFQTSDPEANGVTGEFDIQSRTILTEFPSNTTGPIPASALLSKGNTRMKEKHRMIPVNVDWGFVGGIYVPSFRNSTLGVHCEPCQLTSNTTFSLTARGRLFPLNASIAINWSGDMIMTNNIVLDLTGTVKLKAFSKSFTFYEILLSPISIPGLIMFGPSLRLVGSVDVGSSVSGRVGFQIGMNMSDFNLSVSSKTGIQSTNMRPKISGGISLSNAMDTYIKFALSKELAFGGSVFGKSFKHAAIRLSVIENNHLWDEYGQNCKGADISAFAEAEIFDKLGYIQLWKPCILSKTCSTPQDYE